MAENIIKGFQTNQGVGQYDYNSLANRPTLITQAQLDAVKNAANEYTDSEIAKLDLTGGTGSSTIELDTTLKVSGKAADAKSVGDALNGKLDVDQLQSTINTALNGYATQQWVQDQNYLKLIPSEYVTSTELTGEINSALAQAKDKGDFKGDPGDDYILTEDDKREVANIVLTMLPTWNGGSY